MLLYQILRCYAKVRGNDQIKPYYMRLLIFEWFSSCLIIAAAIFCPGYLATARFPAGCFTDRILLNAGGIVNVAEK
jgi:hypothetical protein